MRLLAACILLAVAALPPASALGMEVDPPGGMVRAETEVAPVVIHLTEECRTLMQRASPPQQSVPVVLRVDAPPSLRFAGPGSPALPLQPCLDGAVFSTVDVTWTVGAAREAPGLKTLVAQFHAELEQRAVPPLEGEVADRSVPVTVAPDILLSLQVPRKVVHVESDRGVATLLMSNEGNVRTQVNVDAVARPSSGRLLLPDPMILDSARGSPGRAEGEARIVFLAGNGLWEREAVTVRVRSQSADVPEVQGEAVDLQFIFSNGNPVERTLPAAPPTLVILALAAVAVAVRRR